MKTVYIISFLLITLTTKLSYSQNEEGWCFYELTVDNKIICSYYYDTTTIEYEDNNNKITVWGKVNYVPVIYSKFYDKYIDIEISKTIFYCKTRKYSRIESIYYFADKSIETVKRSESDSVSIIPDSMGESLFNILCK